MESTFGAGNAVQATMPGSGQNLDWPDVSRGRWSPADGTRPRKLCTLAPLVPQKAWDGPGHGEEAEHAKRWARTPRGVTGSQDGCLGHLFPGLTPGLSNLPWARHQSRQRPGAHAELSPGRGPGQGMPNRGHGWRWERATWVFKVVLGGHLKEPENCCNWSSWRVSRRSVCLRLRSHPGVPEPSPASGALLRGASASPSPSAPPPLPFSYTCSSE